MCGCGRAHTMGGCGCAGDWGSWLYGGRCVYVWLWSCAHDGGVWVCWRLGFVVVWGSVCLCVVVVVRTRWGGVGVLAIGVRGCMGVGVCVCCCGRAHTMGGCGCAGDWGSWLYGGRCVCVLL